MHPIIIDTVVNLSEPQVIHGLTAFVAAPRMTCHDFDAYANLLFLKKLGKITDVTVFGVPPRYDETRLVAWLERELRNELCM